MKHEESKPTRERRLFAPWQKRLCWNKVRDYELKIVSDSVEKYSEEILTGGDTMQ